MSGTVYRLSEQLWQDHTAHRRACGDRLCDHPAHHYAAAHADRRVLVDGVAVDAEGRPMPPE